MAQESPADSLHQPSPGRGAHPGRVRRARSGRAAGGPPTRHLGGSVEEAVDLSLGLGKPWEKHGKTLGKPWENHAKTIRKWRFHDF